MSKAKKFSFFNDSQYAQLHLNLFDPIKPRGQTPLIIIFPWCFLWKVLKPLISPITASLVSTVHNTYSSEYMHNTTLFHVNICQWKHYLARMDFERTGLKQRGQTPILSGFIFPGAPTEIPELSQIVISSTTKHAPGTKRTNSAL